MKPIRASYSVVVAFVAAFSCYYSAFAQVPPLHKGASSDGVVVKETGRVEITKEPKTGRGEPVDAVAKETKTSGFALIGFLPRDIHTYRVETPEFGGKYFTPLVSPRSHSKQSNLSDNDAAQLAKKLLNPVSSLPRISFESNVDFGLAADREGYRYTINLEPVIPFALGKDWNLISRTRIPLMQQDGIEASSVQSGLGDMIQSFFLSPSNTEPFFWGAGAALVIPTATDTRLGSGKFGLGPSVVAGGQRGAWTYGVVGRHIWSVAGHSDRLDVRSTFIQPFVAYTTRSGWSLSLDTESTYDWLGEQWSVPIHAQVTKTIGFHRHPVSVGGALACWAATVPGGPQACGVRFIVTPLFPAR